MIQVDHIKFDYIRRDEQDNVVAVENAIRDVSFTVAPGEFVAILGHNGSGKSTLAKHMNALLVPEEGTIWVDSIDTKDKEMIWDIRQRVGMVFQNPDNQIVYNVVEEDVGFGPENLGVPTSEIWQRVGSALEKVGMSKYRKKSPNNLSGGQKQRVAIAGILAMKPKCIVLDESTAMLDPIGRKEVLEAVQELNKKEHITVLWITHYMEEVIEADKLIVMNQGEIVMEGTPRQVFSQVEQLKSYHLDVPQVTMLAHELRKTGLDVPADILSVDELADAVMKTGRRWQKMILIHELSHVYSPGTVFEKKALDHVDLKIEDGEILGIIGHTGSGKSTLIQHLNGLLKPTEGAVYFNGEDIHDKDFSMKKLRSKIGLVFQYPEHQLFESTVIEDVQFGPKNMGLDPLEMEMRSFEALKQVGMGEEYLDVSPLELSGGQKRRVAIAGVLAMEPDVLILDEPTAGLDPRGRDEIYQLITELHRQRNITVIIVSHSMEDMANFVDRLIVMNEGKVALDGTPGQVFSHYKELEQIGLMAPQVTYVMEELTRRGLVLPHNAIHVDQAVDSIRQALGK